MSSGSQYIYKPGFVIFEVGGEKYDVSYVNLSLALNGVPTCEVGIAPANAAGDIRINKLELVSLKQAFLNLTKKSVELETSYLMLQLYSTNGGPTEIIELQDWVLVSCGMDDVSTTDVFSLSCVMAHPAFKLNLYTGCFFNGAGVLNFEKEVEGVQNPLDAALKTIQVTIDANKEKIKTICEPLSMASTPLKDPNKIKEELVSGMDQLKSTIPEVLKWDVSYTGGKLSIPCQDVGTPVPYGVKYALLDAWTMTMGDQSFWGKLTGQICGDFFLEVVPTYNKKKGDGKLTLAPLNPYGGPTVKMPSEYVSVLNMPGFDPEPIYGVIMYQGQGSAESSASVTFADMGEAAAVIQPVNLAFVPVQSKLAGGQLHHVGDPYWISFAMTKAASLNPVMPRDAGGDTYSQQKENPEQIDKNIKESLKAWNQVRLRYLNAIFMSSYRMAMEAHLSCAFCPELPDGTEPLPGSILVFQSEGELFRGQIQTVVHNVDCANSRASTQISLRYCDVDNGTSNVLGNPPSIPFYNAMKVVDSGGGGSRK